MKKNTLYLLTALLVIHIWKDLSTGLAAWYFHSTALWLAVMFVATLIYLRERSMLQKQGVDVRAVFNELPPE